MGPHMIFTQTKRSASSLDTQWDCCVTSSMFQASTLNGTLLGLFSGIHTVARGSAELAELPSLFACGFGCNLGVVGGGAVVQPGVDSESQADRGKKKSVGGKKSAKPAGVKDHRNKSRPQ